MPGPRGRGFGGLGWWLSAFALLLIAEKPRHGYEIASELRKIGFPIIGMGHMGTVYRTLSSLEMAGFVVPEWDTSVSPPRKIYRITPAGMEYLREIEMELEAMRDLMNTFVERFKGLVERDAEGKD